MPTDKIQSLIYDDYSDRFYFETKVEALERLSKQRGKHADIVNRSNNKRLEHQNKQIHSAQGIFEGKIHREINAARESLKDMVSYKHVLNKISQKNKMDIFNDGHLGTYGPGVSYFELEESRNQAKKDMLYETRRKVQSQLLLHQRKPMPVLDRTKDTVHLLQTWRKAFQGADTSTKGLGGENGQDSTNRGLMLPPIQARAAAAAAHAQNKAVFVTQQDFHK